MNFRFLCSFSTGRKNIQLWRDFSRQFITFDCGLSHWSQLCENSVFFFSRGGEDIEQWPETELSSQNAHTPPNKPPFHLSPPQPQQSLKWKHFLCRLYNLSEMCLHAYCHSNHSISQLQVPDLVILSRPWHAHLTWQVLPTMSPNQGLHPVLSPNSKSTSPPSGKTTFTCFLPAPRHPVTLAKGGEGGREAFNLQICWQLLFFHFLHIQFTVFHPIYRFSDNFYCWEFPSPEITFVSLGLENWIWDSPDSFYWISVS